MSNLRERVADLVRFNKDPEAIADEAVALVLEEAAKVAKAIGEREENIRDNLIMSEADDDDLLVDKHDMATEVAREIEDAIIAMKGGAYFLSTFSNGRVRK